MADPSEFSSDVDGFSDIPDPLPARRAAAAKAGEGPAAVAPREAAPTRAQQERRTLVAEVAVGAWLLAAVFRLGVRDDMGLSLLVRVAALCVVGLVAQRVAAAPGRPLGPGVRVVQGVVLAVPLAFLAVSMLSAHGPPDQGIAPSALLGCFATTMAVAVVPLAFAALLHRRSFAVLPAWRGGALGALGGLMASIVIGVHCPVDAFPHVILAHGTPIALGALVGAALGALIGRL